MRKLFSILLVAVSIQSFAQYPYSKKQIIDLDPGGRKRGTEYGTVYSQTGFADLDTFYAYSGVTPTISNGMIVMGDGSSTGSILDLDWVTSADWWTYESDFYVGEIDGDSYGFSLQLTSENSTYNQTFYAYLEHRSTSGYDGVLSFNEFNGITTTRIAESLTKVSMSVGDHIYVTLKREGNVFKAYARNVTTGAPEVPLVYRYTGLTTAVNTARLRITAVGSDSISHIAFALNESVGAQLMLGGDSKWTWYGTTYNEAIPQLFYSGTGANIVNHGKSGDKTRETVLSLDEVVLLKPLQYLHDVGNDIRNGVSTGTWQANLDTIYNRLTRNGIDVYFCLMYETDVDQSDYITYLLAAYPTKTILNGYYATQNCGNCLMPDGIHLNAFGKQKWADAVLNAGVIDFNNKVYNLKFTVDSTNAGDSIITKRYFDQTREIKVWRNGLRLFEVDSFRANSIRRTNDSIIFQDDPLVEGEDIVIESYPKNSWTVIPPDPPVQHYLLDIATNAENAFSVRKLRAAYSGYCMKVRRSSDNTEQDIGFLNNELDTTALKVFVGANSAYVTKWYNQANADASSDAVQTTSGNQPRIMNSGVIDRVQNANSDWIVAVKFDGSDDALEFADRAVAYADGDWSTFMVQKRTSSGVNGGAFGTNSCCMISPYQNSSDNMAIHTQGPSAFSWYNWGADATATYCLLSGFDIPTSQPNTTIYKDGSAYTMGGDTNAAFSANGIFNRLGQVTNTAWSNAYISEAILYKSDKSSQRATIENNINTFYSLY